jgi:hypothetical protein
MKRGIVATMAVAVVLGGIGALAQDVTTTRIEVSAPIFPNVLVMYPGAGPNYPTTQAGREQLVRDSALTFEFLLEECSKAGYTITPAPDGGTLTQAELAANYNEIAKCSYERYTAKPYWIPKLLSDVDVCGLMLGTGWRMITEADLASMTTADFQYLSDVLSSTAAGSSFGAFYFSLEIFAKAADGSIAHGSLSPTAPKRIESFPESSSTDPYQVGLALRCIRTE